ncbi:unnamed protein product, partial [Prorocentrum cordatum]
GVRRDAAVHPLWWPRAQPAGGGHGGPVRFRLESAGGPAGHRPRPPHRTAPRGVLVVRLMTPTAFDQGLLERTSRKRDLERKVIMAGRFHERLDGEEGGAPLLRQLVRDARAAHGQAPACPAATPLQEANRLLARSPEDNAAFEDADIALLGAPAPGQAGRIEGAAERLERCGRLVTAAETAKVPAAARALPKMARRKKEASTAGAVRRRRQRRAQRQ